MKTQTTIDGEMLLRDLHAFTSEIGATNMEDSRKLSMIVGTILHDIGGYLAQESCFVPRSSGWADRWPQYYK